jgi:hypothetical protein
MGPLKAGRFGADVSTGGRREQARFEARGRPGLAQRAGAESSVKPAARQMQCRAAEEGAGRSPRLLRDHPSEEGGGR